MSCMFCGSTDTDWPYKRSSRIFLLTPLLGLRLRFCRACYRHYLTFSRED